MASKLTVREIVAPRVATKRGRVVKTAISLPDELYRRAEAIRARNGMSRSELYAEALTRWLPETERASVTEQLDRVYAQTTESASETRARRTHNRRTASKHWTW